MNSTATYSVSSDGIDLLALPLDLDQRLTAALAGDNGIQIRAALDLIVNQRLSESGWDGWDGPWSARDTVRAILDVADETDRLAAILEQESVGPAVEVEIGHALVEGAENDYGDAQVTALTLRVTDGITDAIRYTLPADPDDDGRYWQAFEAADAYLAEWLTVHGVDPTATDTTGSGWSVTFPRSQWTTGTVTVEALAEELGVTPDRIRTDEVAGTWLFVYSVHENRYDQDAGCTFIHLVGFTAEGADKVRAHYR